MTRIAKGSFSVEIKPQADPSTADGVSLSRMSLDKQFEGGLAGITGQFRIDIAEGRHLY